MEFEAITLEEKQQALRDLENVREQLIACGQLPAASGSLSARVGDYKPDEFYFAITAQQDVREEAQPPSLGHFLFADSTGSPYHSTRLLPSDDIPLHAKLYRMSGCKAIIHAHTVFGSVMSNYYGDDGYVHAQGFELIKQLGIWEEAAEIRIPVLSNNSSLPAIQQLPQVVDTRIPVLLLRGGGMYVWGDTIQQAKLRLEAMEFISEVLYRSLLLPAK
ncbi:class II aldolase/adducin family protein [Paenibacillus senegalimassiliensis]|uniref:class II aldolase/adducin family protein n=1 Tax=Paenibacillus senegalimassiliensis TaxID=1737426 RepID=UPI00073E5349|nr:class II aldolase/adducin family protein [Paenibacillus senegalimassiliensis]